MFNLNMVTLLQFFIVRISLSANLFVCLFVVVVACLYFSSIRFCFVYCITKTRLFIYIENFTSNN